MTADTLEAIGNGFGLTRRQMDCLLDAFRFAVPSTANPTSGIDLCFGIERYIEELMKRSVKMPPSMDLGDEFAPTESYCGELQRLALWVSEQKPWKVVALEFLCAGFWAREWQLLQDPTGFCI